MGFNSILFNQHSDQDLSIEEPAFFKDLHLDKIINDIVSSKTEYNLKSFFYSALDDRNLIYFRAEVMKDVENHDMNSAISNFASKMVLVRRYLKLIDNLGFDNNKKGWYLDTVLVYCQAISDLNEYLNNAPINSTGLKDFRNYLQDYTSSDTFKSVFNSAKEVKNELLSIEYCVTVFQNRFVVRKYESESDYSTEILHIFDKFRKSEAKDYKSKLFISGGMNFVESKIVDFVSELFPEPFIHLDAFCIDHSSFIDDLILKFDREIQFYIAYSEFMKKIKEKGLNFCYPILSDSKNELYSNESFDAALALNLLKKEIPIITNDFFIRDPERIIVVSGPNQGGKTTFARMFGQLHYFARLGVPVPGKNAKIFLSDHLFTHFEREEDLSNLRGKLQDELARIEEIFSQMTSNSIVIVNEIFTSTTLEDAIFLSKEIISKLLTLDSIGLIVSFIDELSKISPQTVSMVSSIIPDNPALRTFKIIREQSDGLAYALSIARKHRLTYEQIKERLQT